MSFHGATRHFELGGYLRVVTALQEQFDNLLFPRTEPAGLLLHQTYSPSLLARQPLLQPDARLHNFANYLAPTVPLFGEFGCDI